MRTAKEERTRDPRQAVAERNVEAILDGAERLLQSRKQASISAVATEAGLSRVTVYSHFRDRRALLEALVERAVRRAVAALESAEPERGAPADALRRMVAASWEHLDRNEEIGRTAAAELSADGMRRSHEAVRGVILMLVQRGQRERDFRADVTAGWLVTCCLALVHAAVEEVRAGELDSDAALGALTVTVVELFVGRGE